MIVFVDPKSGRGGGQVVLEHLLAELASCDVPLGLVMPEAGRRSLSLPHALTAGSSLSNVLSGRLAAEPVLLVANANASFPAVVMGGLGSVCAADPCAPWASSTTTRQVDSRVWRPDSP